MTESKWSVYRHTCPNGKVYIGMTSKKCEERWQNGHGYRKNEHFFSAIKEYGWNSITHEVIATGLSKERAQHCEQLLISAHKSNNPLYGYNISTGVGKTGLSPTPETRDKIRKKLVGTRRPDEVRARLSASHSGKQLSDEQKMRIRMSCKNINARPVICLTTGIMYPSATEASRQTGISRSGISSCCVGTRRTCKKTAWAYSDRGDSIVL